MVRDNNKINVFCSFSVVRKDLGESGKEELKLDKMVVHLDSDDEDEEMKKAEAPGE